MPSANTRKRRNLSAKAKRSKAKRKKQRRGPVMRFHFSQLILIWVLSLIVCFAAYLYNRNVYPEQDVFLDSPEDSTADLSSYVDDPFSSLTPEDPVNDTPSDSGEDSGEEQDESSVFQTTDKINPVPESAPQGAEYLQKCAFLGETNIYRLGQCGLLQPFNYYASETLTLQNYTKEYVMLEGTTIRILSAVNSASCPIYLMFGTESLGKQPADQTADQFDQLLTSVKATAPKATVYVLSIPPVTSFAETNGENPILNSVIDDYNTRLLDLCNLRDVYFVDVNTALKNNNGKLDAEMAEEDGIHLTQEAGQILLDYVLNHIPVS